MSRAYIVIGANRGIGLGLVKGLVGQVDKSSVIFATARQPEQATELEALAQSSKIKVEVVQVDITDEAQVKELAEAVSASKLPIASLWLNAGIYGGRIPITELEQSTMIKTFTANVVGPHFVFKSFHSLLIGSPGVKVNVLSSSAASIGQVHDTYLLLLSMVPDIQPNGSYTTSKAALNMLVRQWAEVVEPHGVTVNLVHPGMVATEMAREAGAPPGAGISVDESVKGMFSAIDKADAEAARKGMLSYDGTVVPW